MGARASLNVDSVPVSPGERATCELRVMNAGQVVDEFTFEVLGDAAAWSTVEPDVLRLMPGTDQVVTVVLAPPRTSDVVPGPTPFGVKVNSREDPSGTVVVEAVAEVGTIAGLSAELIPRTSRGSRRGRHELAIDNRGNEAVEATIEGRDPDEKVRFEIKRSPLAVGAGNAEFGALTVRPERTFWRGTNRTFPFSVEVTSPAGLTTTVDGAYVQHPLLPPWSFKALAFTLAALVVLAIAWFTLLKPTVESAAKEAVGEEAAAAARQAVAAQVASGSGGGGGGGAAVPPDVDGEDEEVLNLASPFAERLEIGGVALGASGEAASAGLSENQRFVLTDIIFSNPTGDGGTLRLRRGDDTVIYELNLANFRDLDFHFLTPVVFDGLDNRPVLEIENCQPATDPVDGECQASALLTGNVFTVESS